MAKKKMIPRLRLKARIASKVREKDLIDKAKLLMEDPELILPECTEDCGACPFKKTHARIDKILKYKDDPVKLARLARGGDKLARAYAATIALAHEKKTPYLATAVYHGSTVTYVLRGKTPKEKLIAVQNFDSPKWRVLGVLDLVDRKALHFYSYGDHFVCTGRFAKPPQEYVKLAAESVGATKLEGEVYSCPHSPVTTNHIEFDWVTAGKKVLLCDQCAVKAKNSLSKLAEGMAVPKALSEFEISVVRPLKVISGDGDCKNLLNKAVDKALLEEYSNGKIGDRELIDRHMEDVRSELAKMSQRVFVRGDKCFGADPDQMIADLTTDPIEGKALSGLFSKIDQPVVLDLGDSVNKVLSTHWSMSGKDALRAVVSDELADEYYRDDSESTSSPMKVIQQALEKAEHQAVTSQIPTYACLSGYGGFVDKVAKAYKTKGASGALAVIDADKSNDHRIRSMSHALYLALGVTTKAWKFTNSEQEYGKHLEPYAKKLLESRSSAQHHEAFSEFLKQAGCPDDLKMA
jgi:hypothetical protein